MEQKQIFLKSQILSKSNVPVPLLIDLYHKQVYHRQCIIDKCSPISKVHLIVTPCICTCILLNPPRNEAASTYYQSTNQLITE